MNIIKKKPATIRLFKGAIGLLMLSSVVLMPASANATDTNLPPKSSSDFENLTLEQLVNVQVTSVSKKQTALFTSPAAIYVITQDDIRRSGMETLPELLRMVPGMAVAQINANEWAVSSRGFNNEFANKLLVLIDGRSIYTPASGGVFWNGQDVVLEDLDRIEVIRGPGATLWGANALNGVINIITKSARDTQGLLFSQSVDNEARTSTSLRYGGQFATNLFYRVYVKYFNRDGFVDEAGHDTPDDWDAIRGGFRMDWEPTAENNFTFQGDYYNSNAGKRVNQISLSPAEVLPADHLEHNAGQNVLGRWTRTFSDTSELTLQAYYDYVQQGDGFGIEYRSTYDVDLQHSFSLGDRNDIVWGAGYRYNTVKNTPSFNLTWTPEDHALHLFNIFAQDDVTLVRDRLHFTFGSKFEHNNYTGLEIEPSARLLWTPTERQTVWAAVSRATRTPSFFELSDRLNVAAFQPPLSPPVLVSLFGNPNLDVEKVTAFEIGYRIEPAKRLSFDVTAFYNIYDDIFAQVSNPSAFETSPAPPHVLVSSTWQNATFGETYGAELSAQWEVTKHWRLTGSYTWLHMSLHPDPGAEMDSPQQQFQIRSYLDLPHHLELNGAVYYVDQINPQSGGTRVAISSYVRLDLGIVWHPIQSLEVGIWGHNLLSDQHAEFASQESPLRTEVPRTVMGKITWRF